jgi:hypothetical protein
VFYWLGVGAQPSESVEKLFRVVKLNDRYERFKNGEAQEGLLAEAAKLYETRVKSPKTAHSAPAVKKVTAAKETVEA